MTEFRIVRDPVSGLYNQIPVEEIEVVEIQAVAAEERQEKRRGRPAKVSIPIPATGALSLKEL